MSTCPRVRATASRARSDRRSNSTSLNGRWCDLSRPGQPYGHSSSWAGFFLGNIKISGDFFEIAMAPAPRGEGNHNERCAEEHHVDTHEQAERPRRGAGPSSED